MKKLIKEKNIKNQGMKQKLLLISLLFLVTIPFNYFNAQLFNLINNPALYLPKVHPETTLDIVLLETIESTGYGDINDTNSTPAVLNLLIPYKQNFDKVYFGISYVPICDVNQSLYENYLTLYCGNDNEYFGTWNITDDCNTLLTSTNFPEVRWVDLDLTNSTSEVFQSKKATVYNCQFYVNDSSTINRTDFWIKVWNYGNKVTEIVRNETVITGSAIIEETIGQYIGIWNLILGLALNIFPIVAIIWTLFAVPLFFLFMLRRLVKSLKQTVPRLRK